MQICHFLIERRIVITAVITCKALLSGLTFDICARLNMSRDRRIESRLIRTDSARISSAENSWLFWGHDSRALEAKRELYFSPHWSLIVALSRCFSRSYQASVTIDSSRVRGDAAERKKESWTGRMGYGQGNKVVAENFWYVQLEHARSNQRRPVETSFNLCESPYRRWGLRAGPF